MESLQGDVKMTPKEFMDKVDRMVLYFGTIMGIIIIILFLCMIALIISMIFSMNGGVC